MGDETKTDIGVESMDSSAAGDHDDVDANPFQETHTIFSRQKTAQPPTAHVKPMLSDATNHEEYNMNHEKRGLAIIINNHTFNPDTRMPPRSGTHVDAAALKEKFYELGFEVLRYDDIDKKNFAKVVYVAAKMDHSNSDCFCMVILTHGEEGVIYATDGTILVDDIFEPFKGNNCASLIGKPKLFFIQACRGTKLDDGVEYHDAPQKIPDVSAPKIPAEADFLMAYSVVPGYFSWRNSQNGSWFAQALSAVLQKYGANLDLLSMMTRVNKLVAYEFESNASRAYMNNKKQIPCITSMLTKDVYFRPK